MNNFEQLELVGRIAVQPQGRMTCREIDVCLSGFEVEIPENWGRPSSLYAYSTTARKKSSIASA